MKKKDIKTLENIFGSATEISAKAKPKSKRAEKKLDIEFELYVALLILSKAIEGVMGNREESFKKKAGEVFTEDVSKNGRKPDNFDGVSGKASAVFQYKKRGFGFSSKIAEILDKNNIPYEKEEKIAEHFIVNPEVLADQEKMLEVAKAIEKLDMPFQVILKQKAEYKYQFTDETFAAIAALQDEALRETLTKDIATIAISSPKLDSANAVEEALSIVTEAGLL